MLHHYLDGECFVLVSAESMCVYRIPGKLQGMFVAPITLTALPSSMAAQKNPCSAASPAWMPSPSPADVLSGLCGSCLGSQQTYRKGKSVCVLGLRDYNKSCKCRALCEQRFRFMWSDSTTPTDSLKKKKKKADANIYIYILLLCGVNLLQKGNSCSRGVNWLCGHFPKKTTMKIPSNIEFLSKFKARICTSGLPRVVTDTHSSCAEPPLEQKRDTSPASYSRVHHEASPCHLSPAVQGHISPTDVLLQISTIHASKSTQKYKASTRSQSAQGKNSQCKSTTARLCIAPTLDLFSFPVPS